MTDRSNPNRSDDHWLVRPSTIRRLWWVFGIILAGLVVLQVWIPVKGYFGIDGWFAFGAVYGLLSCVAMVLVAKLLGVFLKRPEDYYRRGEEEGGDV